MLTHDKFLLQTTAGWELSVVVVDKVKGPAVTERLEGSMGWFSMGSPEG